MIEVNLLVLGGGKRVSLYERLNSAANELGINLTIFSAELSTDLPISHMAEIIIAPKWSDPKFDQWLSDTVNDKSINIVLPLMDSAVTILSKFKSGKNHRSIYVPTGDFSVATILEDKILLAKFCRSNSIPVIPNNTNLFPKLAKPATGFGGKGHIKLSNINDLIDFQQNNKNSSEYLIQDFISNGKEFSVDGFIMLNGQSYFSIRERLEVISGEVSKGITVVNRELDALCVDIFKKISWRGPITAQFFLINDILYLIEINGRYGGGVINSIEAGLRLDKLLFADFLGVKLDADDLNAKPGCLMMRANREFWKWQ